MSSVPKKTKRKQLPDTYSLEEIIDLFSEPHVFLRELIQNAVDAQVEAGSREPVEVSTEFTPHKAEAELPNGLGCGVFTTQVVDHGTGMNRKDIDSKLVHLWNAWKDDRPELVGSYGVGFLSVFAFEPNAIIVETGRAGESLKLIFKENRRFDRIPLEHEFTGTLVKVVKKVRTRDVEPLQLALRSTLKRWCRMAEIEIRFEGETINEVFPYTEELAWSLGPADAYKRLSVRPRTEDDLYYEFYCNGFLVEQGRHEELSLPGVTFRVDSSSIRYLPTRDKVERDDSLAMILREMRQAVETGYVSHLIGLLVISPNDKAFGVIACYLPSVSRKDAEEPIIPCSDGSRLSLLQVARQARGYKLAWSSREGKDRIVLWDGKSPGLRRLLTSIGHIQGSFLRRISNRLYPPRVIELVEQP